MGARVSGRATWAVRDLSLVSRSLEQVLEEGEGLSRKQAEQEAIIRQLRTSARDASAAAERAKTEIAELRAELTAERASRAEEIAEKEKVAEEMAKVAEGGDGGGSSAPMGASNVSFAEVEVRLKAAVGEAAAAAEREVVLQQRMREVMAENDALSTAIRQRDGALAASVADLTASRDAADAHAERMAATAAQVIRRDGRIRRDAWKNSPRCIEEFAEMHGENSPRFAER